MRIPFDLIGLAFVIALALGAARYTSTLLDGTTLRLTTVAGSP